MPVHLASVDRSQLGDAFQTASLRPSPKSPDSSEATVLQEHGRARLVLAFEAMQRDLNGAETATDVPKPVLEAVARIKQQRGAVHLAVDVLSSPRCSSSREDRPVDRVMPSLSDEALPRPGEAIDDG
ncbi:hypothetical protein HPP92_005353 [Vanilla planifolia]|uniref:Uncharacterized protein n=1 Tax=Vanilla planifolia TaxID=51239 RepID=A0A835RKQ3_VANPL|nr:hypothetical protein HPP92_005681 [Vanilla planifolia]KAG0494359.1 hypothetical protein HPP92_005353 [Vanilla planifolia]